MTTETVSQFEEGPLVYKTPCSHHCCRALATEIRGEKRRRTPRVVIALDPVSGYNKLSNKLPLLGSPSMPRKRSKAVAPKIEAVAKATAEAKVEYSRKTNVTVVVPEDVIRANAGAWLDLISPITQWAGLRGDALRHKRELLRIQQEETLAEIALRARQRLSKELAILTPVPVKFLVPFLEQASLEEADSTLVDLWANLLTSAAEEFDPHHIHFVGIISRLSPSQAEVLKEIIGTESAQELHHSIDVAEWNYASDHIPKYLEGALTKAKVVDERSFPELLPRFFDRTGFKLAFADFRHAERYYHRRYEGPKFVDYSILEAMGLVRRLQTNVLDIDNWFVKLVYHRVTNLGFAFATACKIVT